MKKLVEGRRDDFSSEKDVMKSDLSNLKRDTESLRVTMSGKSIQCIQVTVLQFIAYVCEYRTANREQATGRIHKSTG